MLIEINVPTTELAVFAREPVAAVAAIINTPAAAAATHTRRRVLRDHFCLPIISPKRTREGIAPLPVAHRPASFLPSPHPMMDQREVLLVLLILHPNVGLGFFLVEAVTCPLKTGPGVKLGLGWMKGGEMPRKRHTPEQVIHKLREAEVALAQGSTVAETSRQIGVTEQTFYRWRTEYGGLRIDQVKRLKRLESENTRLKRAIGDLTLDNQILPDPEGGS